MTTAQELIKKHSLSAPPVNVFEIAQSEGIQVVYFEPAENPKLEDVSGLLDKPNKKIYLNITESAERQNYTLAHELGHYFLNHQANEYGVYKRNAMYLSSKPAKETEADRFAAQLLMPADMVKSVMKEYELSALQSPQLATIFGVSRQAMAFRLKNLGHTK